MIGYKKPRIKICCISSKKEAQMAIQFGASALGMVGDMPSGPYSEIKKALPGIKLFQVIHVIDEKSVEDYSKK
jgi:phosphoribosylanthranilate isomerase